MLGLAKDVAPLMASNYKSMKNRNWRSSLLAPLAANFMAVLYKIGNILYHVAFYFNEKRMRITLNDGSTCEKCEWSKIKEKLEQYIYDYRCTSDTDINYPSYSNSNPYWNFSTMTAYSLVSSNEIKKTQSDIPVQIFAVMQHGVTRPSDELFKEWTRYDAYKYKITARAEMSWSDINFIQNWSCSLLKVTNDIEGSFKVKSLANRIRKAFPNLFTKTFELKNFKVLSRPEQICKDYGELFLQSIFTDESIKSEKWENDNQLLMVSSRPKEISKGEKCGTVFLNCILKNKSTASQPEWEHNNQLLMMDKLNKDYLKDIAELEKFKKSDVVKNVLKRVSVKMGLEPGAFGDDFGFIYYAYNACRFERSFNDQSFPALCRIFCREDLKVLEYIYDLLWYYTAGYGNPSNLQQACPMARSLLETFKRKTEGNGPNGTFHFGNALNIFNIYVMLGLAKDDAPIKSSNYKDMVNRKWKSSSMVPWLANFMAVLFKNKIGEYYVAFYFNEKRTPITLNDGNACEECPWTEIEKLLLKYINDNQC
ncbi:multiple inositol polyphosphate phosphatase 1-like [Adelges cooleyi]|uniref:multiple inositol polyphosphate phosphatase 1-like n=1 Tax=Adelges cooleyi TaxID=133065 RepID=UPI00217F6834|nr:multiple inositol polyphosphate phosphatase 1-like [Adelges cooleyi]